MAGTKTISNTTPAVGAMNIQQSTYGMAVAIVWGRTRINGNLIWYGDFKAVPHTEVTQSGGKGGGGVRQESTTFTYTAAVAMALGEGVILGVRTCWRGKNVYSGSTYSGSLKRLAHSVTYAGSPITVPSTTGWVDISVEMSLLVSSDDDWRSFRAGSWRALRRGVEYTAAAGVYTFDSSIPAGAFLRITYTAISTDTGSSCLAQIGLDLKTGAPGQAPWSYMTTNHPAQAIGYSGIAYVIGADYSLTDGATVENHAFEVETGFSFSDTIPDANPAPVVVDALSNPHHGAQFGTEKIGSMADYTAACTAQGIFLSPALTEQMSAADFLNSMAALTNVGLVWSGGVLKFVPYADMPLTGNGVTFTPNTAPIYDLNDDDFQDEDQPVLVNRGSVQDTFNSVRLEYLDRANSYNIAIMEQADQADIQENGPRPMDVIKAHWITDVAVAKVVATLILQRKLFVRNTYEFSLNWTKIVLEPMDLVTISDPALGMDRVPVRILTMDENEEGLISFVAEDFPKGSASATLYPTAPGVGFAHNFNESPGAVLSPVIFEAPAAMASGAGGLELWLAAGGTSATYGGCEVWVSLTGSNFQRAATLNGSSRYGATTSALSAGTAGAVTTETLGITLSSGGQLLAGTTADMNALSTLCYVGGEFVGYEGATLTGAGAYTIGNHMLRGAYLSAAASHASGVPFVRCDEGVARMPLTPDYIGKTLHIKLLPFNRYGGGLGDLASANEYTYTVTGVQANNAPVAPAGLALEGPFTIDTAKFKWNAVSNAARYNVQVLVGGVLKREVNVGNAQRFDYSAADALTDGGPWRALTLKVQGINQNGAAGAFSTLAVSNPQMGALSGVAATAGVRTVQFSCAPPSDLDFQGVIICLSATSGFTPGSGNTVYNGPSTAVTINALFDGSPLSESTTYYMRAAAYDTFDASGLNWSSQVAVTPNGSGTVTWATISGRPLDSEILNSAIVIGGRNLYSQTTQLYDGGSGSTIIARAFSGFTIRGIVANTGIVRMDGVIPKNGTYTISFDLAIEFSNGYPLTLDFCDAQPWTINPTTVVQHFERTFDVSNYSVTYDFIDFNGLSAQNYVFTNFKVENGNKATGWTPSPEDVAAASAAAQAAADAANAAITAISSDNILSKGEKPQVILDWETASGEKAGLDTQAGALGVDHTSYDNSYDALANYLVSLRQGGAYPLWNDTSGDNPIVAADFRAAWNNYYTAKITLLNAISAKAATAPSAIIGGANLYPDGGFEQGTHPCSSHNATSAVDPATTNYGGVVAYSGSKFLFFDTTGGTSLDMYLYLGGPLCPVKAGRQYTYSFMYYTATNSVITAGSTYLRLSDSSHVTVPLPVLNTGAWTLCEFQWTCPAGITTVEARFGLICNSYSWMAVDCIQMEEGNKRTQWTPALVDLQADAQAKADAAQANAISTAAAAAQAKADLAETTAKAYADGIVTDEEARAILDATNKANAAQTAAQSAAAADATAKANAAALTANWSGVANNDGNKPANGATVGAPAGTNVGSTPAATVESKANGAIPNAANAVTNSNLITGAAQTADIFSSFSGSTKYPFVMPRAGTVIIKARVSIAPADTNGITLYYEGSAGSPGSVAATGTYYETGSATAIRDVWIMKQLAAGNYWIGPYDTTNVPLDAYVEKFIA